MCLVTNPETQHTCLILETGPLSSPKHTLTLHLPARSSWFFLCHINILQFPRKKRDSQSNCVALCWFLMFSSLFSQGFVKNLKSLPWSGFRLWACYASLSAFCTALHTSKQRHKKPQLPRSGPFSSQQGDGVACTQHALCSMRC